MTKSPTPDADANRVGVGAGSLYALACGFIPSLEIRALLIAASPAVGWIARQIFMRVASDVVLRDAKKNYDRMLKAIEREKRRGTTPERLIQMEAFAEIALLRYMTLLGGVSGAAAELEKLSKGEDP